MMGRVAELGCGRAAHTAAHRAAEHAETDRHTHAAPHLPSTRTAPHLSGARAEADLPGPATPGTGPAAPDAAGQFGRGYVTRRAVRRAVHVARLLHAVKTEAAESFKFRGFPVGPAGFEPATP